MEKLAVKVERETFEMDGKTYFGYFIKGNIRGRDVKIEIKPPDNGGYTVLDIVFDGAMSADLEVTPFEMKTNGGRESDRGQYICGHVGRSGNRGSLFL